MGVHEGLCIGIGMDVGTRIGACMGTYDGLCMGVCKGAGFRIYLLVWAHMMMSVGIDTDLAYSIGAGMGIYNSLCIVACLDTSDGCKICGGVVILCRFTSW